MQSSRTALTLSLASAIFLIAPHPARAHERALLSTPDIEPHAWRTLIIYNESYPDENGDGIGDSEELAFYYREKRGVPPSNMLPLACKTTEGYYAGEWTMFFDEVVTPLHTKLAELGPQWIYYFAVCYGVPITIDVGGTNASRALDAAIAAPYSIGDRETPLLPQRWWNNPYLERSPGVPPDKGRFDHTYTLGFDDIYCVTRLEGDDVRWAKELVDRALYGEKYIAPAEGYHSGFGYIDTQYGYYTDEYLLDGYPFGYQTYEKADRSMAFGKFFVEDGGWELKWEYYGTEIGETGAIFHDGASAETAPSALWYEGWYNYGKYQDVWEWLVGAVACDLNSNSGAGVRRPQTYTSFLSQAFYRGLTAGAGVTDEPYLNGHYRPEVLLYYILNGHSFAEASFVSNPTIGWRDHAIGDPLYTPNAPKVPEVDATPPPLPLVVDMAPDGGGDTARVIAISIETVADAPDLFVSRIDWGLDTGYGNVEDFGAVFHMEEERILTGLSPSSTYHYMVTIVDPAGNVTETGDFEFTTLP